jgi:protocatechuate 3,4-dioxygenase beta subunit
VYGRLGTSIRILIVIVLGMAGALAASAQAPATASPTTQARRAQVTTATVRGTIADPTGALIPGATVNLVNSSGAAVATTTSDASGTYVFSNLAPGSYVVHAEFPGFAPVSVPAFTVTPGQIKHIEIAMSTVVEEQSITVSDEEAPMVSSRTS